MSDDLGSAPTQEFARVRADAVATREVPYVTAAGPGHTPLPTQGWSRPVRRGRMAKLVDRFKASPAWVAPVALLTCFAGAAAFVVATDPTDDVGPTTCAFKLVTGFDCPGCGGTRAFFYLLHGNIPEAARNHAVALFAAPFLVWLYASWATRRVFPKLRDRIPVMRVTAVHATWFLAVWAVYWVVRNLPFAPFTALYV